MSSVPQPGGAQLLQYLRWAGSANVPFAALLVLLYFLVAREPVLLILAGVVALNNLFALSAYLLARQERDAQATLTYSAGLWMVSLAVGMIGLPLLSVATILAILAVIVAIPHVGPRTLLRMSLVATGTVLVNCVWLVVEPPLDPKRLSQGFVRLVVGCGLSALAGLCGLTLWHNRRTLADATAQLEAANRALRDSGRVLEARVRERTAELEQSRRELVAARDEALAANRHKSTFLANMSHELRTPLNAIIGFSEVLGAKLFGELGAKQAEYIEDIHASGHHLLSLINDILDLSKIEAGRLDLSLSTFDLSAAIDNALTLMRERASRRGVRLHKELPPAVGAVTADERAVKQILINLLTNAVKFTEKNGSVTVNAEPDGQSIVIAVRDTGIGIPKEDQAVIFEEFRQGSGDYTRKQEGTGLGLALSKRLVELHGGRIWVESEPGRGSTFRFTLPAQPSSSAPMEG